MTQSTLAEWANFYIITGSAAAGLTGLTFVVIALAADARRPNATALHAYVTPTIVHFGTVLLIATYMNVPRHTAASLSTGLGAIGLAGLVYVGLITARMNRMSEYIAVREDWIWNVIAPAIAYGALWVLAILSRERWEQPLYVVAAISVVLLFVGIRNAWDVAVWNTVHKQPEKT